MYLDNAATSQKPQAVIDAVTNFYTLHNANIHRGIYSLSQDATTLFETARARVAQFIGAKHPSEIIFTANASEAINLVAYGWGRKFLQKGDIIVTSEMEHHSNIVPWFRLMEEKGIKLIFLPITQDFRLDYKCIFSMPIEHKKIKLVALSQASNVLGTVNMISDIITFFTQNGIKSTYLIDAAQSVPHMKVNVEDLSCDFLAFSSHKLFGPSGVGVLWAKKVLLEEMDPLFVGSHMIKKVTKEKAIFADIPDKFETGTRNLEGVIGLGVAIDFVQTIGIDTISDYEKELTAYALKRFITTDQVRLYGSKTPENRVGVFSFSLGTIHPHDVAEVLNRSHIAVRSGHHCAQTVMDAINQQATVRASLSLYNTKEDVDKLFDALEKVKKTFTRT